MGRSLKVCLNLMFISGNLFFNIANAQQTAGLMKNIITESSEGINSGFPIASKEKVATLDMQTKTAH